jgi:malonate-semialdehyde dehydrogenase (acetylating)/methylmalonate-semialdehyde dehydrogenase
MTHKISHWINNKKILPHHEKFFPVYNPATGEVSKQVAAADSALVDEAVAAAQKAFPAWANTPVAKRAKIMFKLKELIEKNINEIARLVSEEHGKLLDDAKGAVLRGLEDV